MYMEFIGRKKEIEIIDNLLDSKGFKGAIVYGRRRLGKTELLKHCLFKRNKKTIYYQCSQTNEETNVKRFIELIEYQFNVSNLSFSSFEEALRYVIKNFSNEKLYIVIDEYPFLRSIVKGMDSFLQNIIDDNIHNENLYLFLCGSSVSIMKEVMSSSSPLYRRFEAHILLKEMNYYDSSLFYPELSNEDKVMLYSALGGIPYYNKMVNDKLSAKTNIINILIKDYNSFYQDIVFGLKDEISKINNMNSVFDAIAKQNAYKYKDILIKSGINNSPSLNDALDKLIEIDLIKKISPINEINNKYKTGYEISSNCIKFFYKYIFNNFSLKEMYDDDVFYEEFIEKDFLTQFIPKSFESISKDFLSILNNKKYFKNFYLNIGKYYYDDPINKRNGEFDVVTSTKDGYIFYEIKYKNKKLTLGEIKKEIEQVNQTSLKSISYGFISKVGFEEEVLKFLKDNEYSYFTLDDIYF